MKRILIFSLTYHPFVGGAEIAIKEITDRVDPAEYEFHMITLRFDSELPSVEKVGNVLVHRVGLSSRGARVSDRAMPFSAKLSKLLFPFLSFSKALQLNAKYRYDLTWAMMANQAGFGALFFSWTHPRIPYVLELQDGRALHEMKKRRPVLIPLWWLYKRIYLSADTIKAISNFIADEVCTLGYAGRIEVIPNAVDVAKFCEAVPDEMHADLKKMYDKKIG